MTRLPALSLVLFAGLSATTAMAAPPVIEDAGIFGGTLRLEFDQPMLTWATPLRPDNLRLQPAVACDWAWQDDTTLTCAPPPGTTAGFAGATRYRLQVGAGLWSQAGEALAPAGFDLLSSRPALRASVDAWRDGRPLITLFSELPVTREAVAAVLELRLDGEPLAFTLGEPTTRYGETALRLQPDWGEARGGLQLSVRAGLRSPAGPEPGLADKALLGLVVAPDFALADVACEHRWEAPRPREDGALACRPEERLTLRFTRRPGDAALAAIAASLPEGLALAEDPRECDYRCREDRYAPPQHAVALDFTAGGLRLDWSLPPGLRSEDGQVLPATAPLKLRVDDYAPGLAEDERAVLALPGTAARPPLRARNLAGQGRWVDLAVGAGVRQRERAITLDGPRNAFHPLPRPDPDRGVARQGGLLLSGLRSRPDSTQAVVVAPFHLMARQQDGEVLAWASDWASGRGLAGVALSVLEVDRQGKARELARGQADAGGVARLAVPPVVTDARGQAPLRFLRARDGRRTTVVPLASFAGLDTPWLPWFEWPEGAADFAHRTFGSGARVRFGVSDRQLYAPGDTVHFRLWLRQREGQRLRAVADAGEEVTVVLREQDEDAPVAEWTARLDARASLAGEKALPALLPDGTYCIDVPGEDDGGRLAGACFRVARYQAQPLWVRLDAPGRVLRAGETLALQAEAGFYSGGPGANLRLWLDGVLARKDFAEVHPAFEDFQFDEGGGESGDPLQGVALPTRLDAKGRARVETVLPARIGDEDDGAPIGFGELRFSAMAGTEGAPSASSPPAVAHYARHAHYVGLRSEGWWLSQQADPVLEAVVATHDGQAVPDATVQVRITRLADRGRGGDDGDDDREAEVLARCTLPVGQPTACPFRAPEPGRYRLVAEAEGAAPTTLDRYFGARAPEDDANAPAPVELTLLSAADGGQPARLQLRQPHARAMALVVVETDRVLAHWLQPVGPEAELDVPVSPEWAPSVAVRVFLRPDAGDAAAGLAQPTRSAVLRVAVPRAALAPVRVRAEREALAPGEDLVLELHNPSTREQLLTLSVLDDSVHAQAAELHPLLDPDGPAFFGRLHQWRGADWFGLSGWRYLPPLFFDPADPVVMEGGVPMPAAAPPAGYDRDTLDTIEVTGSRLKRADVVALDTGSGPPPRARPAGGPPTARRRSQFPDTAYWQPGLALAPGETRTLRIPLPDNLTRWRVLAWSSDAGDGFALQELTVTASLPLELRASLPAALYPGDAGSGTLSARVNGEPGRAVSLQARAEGAGAAAEVTARADVPAFEALSRRLPLAPTEPGPLQVLADAQAGDAADAIAAGLPVRPRWATAVLPQVGWLDAGSVRLAPPVLPPGARDPTLRVTVSRGLQGLRQDWLDDLRDYPHRCWEQTLSRSLGAALALQDPATAAAWPDAQAVVDGALAGAAAFRAWDGGYRYFTRPAWDGSGDVLLSAHTLQGFLWLRELGQAVPDALVEPLQDFLGEQSLPASPRDHELERQAVVLAARAAAGETAPDREVARLWQAWPVLSWHARSELARVLARQPGEEARRAEALSRLRIAGRRQGLRRVIDDTRDFGFAMGSSLRDQCAVTATLYALDRSAAGRESAREHLRGLQDLYAGGTPSLDTQASLHCLLALRAAAAGLPEGGGAQRVLVARDGEPQALELPAGSAQASASAPLGRGALALAPVGEAAPLLNFLAEVEYRQDLATAPASAVGMRLSREYAVLRGRGWVAGATPRAGDWVRVTLRLQVPAMRHFVAITDPVPGGWVSRDLALANVASAALQARADPGSWWFDERQTGAGEVRLYARQLPPGTHEVHYYAQAVHAGRYLAPPAVAELMYGRGSRASTAAATVRVDAAD